MTAKTDLQEMLDNLDPVLQEGNYVFISLADDLDIAANAILGSFREEEGTTFILAKEKADALQLSYDYVSAWITLNVHSSLSAVGLTATISSTLAAKGISCNIVAAYYHDHLFVDKKNANSALRALSELTNTKGQTL